MMKKQFQPGTEDFLTKLAKEPEVCKPGEENKDLADVMKRLKDYSPIIRKQVNDLYREHMITQQTQLKYPRR